MTFIDAYITTTQRGDKRERVEGRWTRLQQSDHSQERGNEGASAGHVLRRGAGELDGGGHVGGRDVAGRDGGLGLAVLDLGNDGAGRGLGLACNEMC